MAAGAFAGESFALLSYALASMIEREARDLEILREQEATPRPHGRPQGLEWAIASLEQDIERTRQARELLTRLAPIEVDVRAMLEGRTTTLARFASGVRPIAVQFVGDRT